MTWNEATFSASRLPRDLLLVRLSEVLDEHGFETGHRIRNLTYGESIRGGDLCRAALDPAVGKWKGLSFDIIWNDGSEMDARLWRDDDGAHHLVLAESGAAFAGRAGGPLHDRFLALCTTLCERLELRYAVYEREPLDRSEKLAPASRERALGLLARGLEGAPGLVILPREELAEGVQAQLPAHVEPVHTDSGLSCVVFLPAA